MIQQTNSSVKGSTKTSTGRMWSVYAQSLVARCAVMLVMSAAVGILFIPSSSAATNDQGRFKVHVLVLTTFDGEIQPWLTHEQWPLMFKVNGAHGVVRCQKDGICITTTGEGKSNSGPALTAILDAPNLNTTSAYFIVAAIAGTRPDAGTEGYKGTLGFAGIARWVVDGDLGTHFDYRDVTPHDPPPVRHYAWIPVENYENAQFHLNEQLANKAYELSKNIELADDATAQAARNLYPSQRGMHPFVALCDTVGADNFFAGTHAADTMDHIVRERSNGAATNCTSEFEDPGFANALRLHGKLDRLIIVRTASDFETPAPGQTTVELLNSGFPGYAIATENEYRVGSKIAHALTATAIAGASHP
jgi:purine nucleoside permease